MKIISIKENPEYKNQAINYIQKAWPEVPGIIYEDCINHMFAEENLPQWYLLEKDNKIIGCAGLITNDFISRMDLYPWLCALYIEETERGNNYGLLLIEKAIKDSRKAGFKNLYLTTDLVNYYEKYGFKYIGQGYHPWDEESKIYGFNLKTGCHFKIREEKPSDHKEIHHLIQTAFKTAKVKDGDEQDFAEGLRKGKTYIPELALVAEDKGKLIGHILFTKLDINLPDGDTFEALLVAPLSVLIEYRNLGVGSALMNEGFERAKKLGYKAVFLCGDPNYYERFGFKSTIAFNIKPIDDMPSQFVLGKELTEGALNGISGSMKIC